MSSNTNHATYTNPVYPHDFPDPFVLRFRGRYYAYATGRADDGRFFRLASSLDLVHWEAHGGALEPLAIAGAEDYWAPEVAYSEGRFYLYYATGHSADPDHHLRVAVAEHPLGPWCDMGKNLTPHEIFAIDAHPFRDPRDGLWYLYYARDLMHPPYAGTGLAVDRLTAMDRLEGNARDVLRPYADWQVFELHRAVKNNLDWYTIEGPFVVLHEGRYVCFYSGGRWENPNYGVGYALADHPLGPWMDDANAAGPQVLFTAPGQVIGPGHNSVILGPDLTTPYIVYHGWDPDCTARTMRIDELLWLDGRPGCAGPSSGPVPAPRLPDRLLLFDEPSFSASDSDQGWERIADGLQAVRDGARLKIGDSAGEFRAEVSLRHCEGSGVAVGDLEILIGRDSLTAGSVAVPLPPGFRPDAWHTLLLHRSDGRLDVVLDDYPSLSANPGATPAGITLVGSNGCTFGHAAVHSAKK